MFKNLHLKEYLQVMGLMKKKKWLFYITIMICALYVSAFAIVNSFMYKNIINGVVYGNKELLHNALLLISISLLLACVVNPISSYICAYLSKKTVFDLRVNLFNHIMRLPRGYFDNNHSGEILSQMTNDVDKIQSVYDGQLYNVILHFIVGVAATVTILKLDWRLGGIMIMLGVITTIVNTAYAKPIRSISDSTQAHLGKATERFLDIIAGIRVIKLFNINEIIVKKFKEDNDKVINEQIKLTAKEAEVSSMNILLSLLTFVGVLVPGVFMVHYKIIDLGTVIAILTLKMQVFCLFEEFGGFFITIQKSLAGAKRVFKLLDETEERQVTEVYRESANLDMQKSAVVFNDIVFSYDGIKNVIDGISIDIKKEKVTAIVGLSGSGKSTIIKLLMGLYVPQRGKIVLNGDKDKLITLKELRDKLAYVSQEAFLFQGTIGENIRYGNYNATTEEVIASAKLANAHNFIMSMPENYDTRVEENGTNLSGGQRQCIAIARALLKNASILLLDEATSALDLESEFIVQDAINKLMKGRTTIVIAHRLSTIQNADKIYVIEDGKVIEEGVHESLIEMKGAYKFLYDSQFKV
jgi:ABC-type multidrug transport system fused ATPase/permease subunit